MKGIFEIEVMKKKQSQEFKTIQSTLYLKRKEYITPHYIRITLEGDDIPLFENTTIGVNNKVFIPPPGMNTIHFPYIDHQTMEWVYPAKEVSPSIRTYTHRGIDLANNELWIDFVAHGENGPASAWAINAQIGDCLGVMMRDAKTELYTKADHYLLVGDATAIPVISAILEDLPRSATVCCVLEVYGTDDIQRIETDAMVDFHWLFNPTPEKGSEMAEYVKNLQLPTINRFGYIAAEFSTVKSLRTYLRKEVGWQQHELYAYSYWKTGKSEDHSQKDRQQENQEIA